MSAGDPGCDCDPAGYPDCCPDAYGHAYTSPDAEPHAHSDACPAGTPLRASDYDADGNGADLD